MSKQWKWTLAAALFLAVSHYLAIKNDRGGVAGVALCPEFTKSLEAVRSALYDNGVMEYNKALQMNEAINGE